MKVSAFLGLNFRLKSNKHLLPNWLFLADEQEQRPDPFSNLQTLKYVEKGFYPPLSVGVSPNSVHRPTDMSRELSTVTTAARARPHLDFTMSILPARKKKKIC